MTKEEFLGQFNNVFDMNDPDFTEKFMAATGIKPGDTVTMVSSPHRRPKNWPAPSEAPTDWESLRALNKAELKAMGCGVWDEPDENNTVLMLLPGEWYSAIPNGFEGEDINGNPDVFERGATDDDIRFGCLAFGIRVKVQP
jgi:hypothetical protein